MEDNLLLLIFFNVCVCVFSLVVIKISLRLPDQVTNTYINISNNKKIVIIDKIIPSSKVN